MAGSLDQSDGFFESNGASYLRVGAISVAAYE